MHNDGNYISSLSQVVRWLGTYAENLGVEIYPGFSASEVVYHEDGSVKGIATRDVGINKDGTPKETFMRGMELHGKQTLSGEGCRGSCSESVMARFDLREGTNTIKGKEVKRNEQVYGLGIKEVWEIDDVENHPTFKPGYIQHTAGWPMDADTYGGSFLYHMAPNMILMGFVTGLDYKNPYLSPYEEFQRWKHHPEVVKHLDGASCVGYGARCINEGGIQSIPKLTFPGGALIGEFFIFNISPSIINFRTPLCSHPLLMLLFFSLSLPPPFPVSSFQYFLLLLPDMPISVGCSAGFLNVPKIKGTHTAMKSGMLAAESIYAVLCSNQEDAPANVEDGSLNGLEASDYQTNIESSWVWEELEECRNVKPSFEKGLYAGSIYTGIASMITKGNEPFTLEHSHVDSETTGKAKDYQPIAYPKPDGKISFDLLSNLARSGTNHEDQPAHLRIKPEMMDQVEANVSYKEFAGPEQRFCPAKVYEYNLDGPEPTLVINAQNCVHCKCCSIKMPNEYIDWTVPEGGGGPAYQVM
jgi:electron-transferring-flavoprotein dehydrogenase